MSQEKTPQEKKDNADKNGALFLLVFLFLLDLIVYGAILAGPHKDAIWPMAWAALLTLTGVGHLYVFLQGARNMKEDVLTAAVAAFCWISQLAWTWWGFVFWMSVNQSVEGAVAVIGVIVAGVILAVTELAARSLAYNQII